MFTQQYHRLTLMLSGPKSITAQPPSHKHLKRKRSWLQLEEDSGSSKEKTLHTFEICYFCRFRPTQTKTKKTKTETKLEFFGFEDKEEEESEEGPEGGAQGKSSYKIKYFGFDDLSESDSDDDSCQVKEKKARKAAAVLASLSSSVDSPHTSDSQDSQASSNTGLFFFLTSRIYAQLSTYRCPLTHRQFDFPTDAFDFSDESSPGATEGHKGRTGKSSDKSKDTGTGLKKIFSGPKKVLEHFIICLY